jgi:trans-aconitate methyltransferase
MAVYEFDGEQYKRASAHQKEWGGRIIEELPLRGDESVLDLGCGDGALTQRLATRVPAGRVIGIDSSWGMIKSAKPLERDNLEFRLMDMVYLNVEDEFHLVFSNATLQWIKDQRQLLRSIHRSLKPDGIARFNFAGDGNCANFVKVVREAMSDGRFAKYFEKFDWPWFTPTVDEYRELVETIGFRHVRVWDENADRYFADADEMTMWIDQPCLVPFVKRLTGKDREDFRNRVVDQMIDRTRQDDGTCFETFRRINVVARK